MIKFITNLFKNNEEEIKEEKTFKIYEEELPDDYRVEVTKKDEREYEFEVYKGELFLGIGREVDFGGSYLWGKKFIDRLEDTEPIVLWLYYEGYKTKYIINHHSASYILDNFADKEIDAIEFYDYGRDKFFSIKKDVLREISLKNYVE